MEQINYRAASEELTAYAKRIKSILSLSDLLDKGASLQDQVNELEKRKTLAIEALVRADEEVRLAKDKAKAALEEAKGTVEMALKDSKTILDDARAHAREEVDRIRTEAAKDVKDLTARSNAISAELAKSEAILKKNAEAISAQEKTLADLKENLRKIKETL